MVIDNAKNIDLCMLNSFFRRERKRFPSYFKIKELREQYEKGNLYLVVEGGSVYGFYVLEGEKLKNLYVDKDHRKTGVVDYIVEYVKYYNKLITVAINEKSRRMKKFVKKYGFVCTDRVVQGKESELVIYRYKRFDFIS